MKKTITRKMGGDAPERLARLLQRTALDSLTQELAPNVPLELDNVVYVNLAHLPSARVQMGELNIPNADYVWLAHESPLSLETSRPLRYLRDRLDEATVLIPQPSEGLEMTLTGNVEMPERFIEGIKVDERELRVVEVYTDPRRVIVGTSHGLIEGVNVPYVRIMNDAYSD